MQQQSFWQPRSIDLIDRETDKSVKNIIATGYWEVLDVVDEQSEGLDHDRYFFIISKIKE